MRKRMAMVATVAMVALAGCSSGSETTPPKTSAPPTSVPSSPAATKSSEPSPAPTAQDVMALEGFVALDPGTYFIDPDADPSTPLRVAYEVPVEGWSQWIGAAKFAVDEGHVGVSITTVENVVRQACRNHSPADPPVGPGVDDLATALANLAPFRVTSPPKDVTVDGYRGKHLELTVPDLPADHEGFTKCVDLNLASWMSPNLGPSGDNAFTGYSGPGERDEFWILDVDGTRLMIAAERSAGSPSQALAEQQDILDSIRIEPDGIPADPPVEPRPAPAASGALAYALDGDIYVADPDGSNVVKIADGRSGEDCDGTGGENYSAEGSMWSPDGRYLAYRYTDCSHPKSGGGGVISDAEGNVLAKFPLDGWQIAWSPDSTRVAVWDGFGTTIGVYGLDGARQAQLTLPPGWTWRPNGDHDPKWMHDGTSVWVESLEFPLDGSAPRFLPSRGSDPYATYSPDGSLVAYGGGSLTVARSDGSEHRVVFDRGGLEVAPDWGYPWSATGDRIAVTTSGHGPARGSDELGVVDVATGSVTMLTEGERGAELHAIGFSPRGDRILFSSTVRNGGTDESSLWSVGVDGSDARLIVAGTWEGEWLSR